MRLRRGIALAVVAAAGWVIGATVVSQRNGRPLLPGPARRQARAEDALRVILPEVRLRATPLEKALLDLQVRSGVNFVIDWESIESSDPGVRRDVPVDLRLFNVTVEQALQALLGYDRTGRYGSVEYTLFDGAVVISTDEEVAGYVYAAVYDLRDIDTGPPTEFDPTFQMQAVPPGLQSDQSLVRLIADTVAPDSWYFGSPGKGLPPAVATGGTVHAFRGRVVAVTTWQNHRRIRSLVSQLRNPVR